MGFMAAGGAALSAAGSVANMMQQKKNRAAADKIRQRAQEGIDKNSAAAKAKWNEALTTASPADQQKMKDDAAAKRLGAYEQATGGVADATNVMHTTEGSPALVKTEAAKQLGDKLSQMRLQMQAKSRLGGWDDRGVSTAIKLGETGHDISQYGNFSAGLADQASRNAENRMKYNSGIGDILTGAGSLMMGGASMGGAMGGAGAGGLGSAGAPMNMGGSSWNMPADPSFWDKAMKWGTTPLGR